MNAIEVNAPARNDAKLNDPHQGGDKAAPRMGANNGHVDHHMVDGINHAAHSSRVKGALAEMGHHNVRYHDGGER